MTDTSYSLWTWDKDESGTEYGKCSLHGTTWQAGQDVCHGCFAAAEVIPNLPAAAETITCCGTCGRDISYGDATEMHWYGGHHDCAECNTPRETCSRCKWMAETYGPRWETEPISDWH